jgi:hypothetical protein
MTFEELLGQALAMLSAGVGWPIGLCSASLAGVSSACQARM